VISVATLSSKLLVAASSGSIGSIVEISMPVYMPVYMPVVNLNKYGFLLKF
jgi:hypothetical protein